jgi:hypothetical protein
VTGASGCEEDLEDEPEGEELEDEDAPDELDCTTAAAWLFLLSAGSWPEASWKKIIAQAAAKAVTEAAITRLRIVRMRRRRPASSCRARSRACWSSSGRTGGGILCVGLISSPRIRLIDEHNLRPYLFERLKLKLRAA